MKDKKNILEKQIEGLQKTIQKQKNQIADLQRENHKLRETLKEHSKGESMVEGWIVFNKDWHTPYCSEHGAILCMDKERGIWRCPSCHIGVSTHGLLEYIREEFDGIIYIQ